MLSLNFIIFHEKFEFIQTQYDYLMPFKLQKFQLYFN
jgi:hypothetical protein